MGRKTFDAAQAEPARRKAAKSSTKMTPTGLSSYTSKHTFSERLICSEYRSLYCSAEVNEVHEPNKCVQTGDDRQHRMLICLRCGGKAAHGPESPVPTPFSARKPASAKGGRLLRRHSCDLERRPASFGSRRCGGVIRSLALRSNVVGNRRFPPQTPPS